MKTKNLVIIFILFLLMTLGSGAVVFLTREKSGSVVAEQPAIVEKQTEPAEATSTAPVKNTTPQTPPSGILGTGLVRGEKKIAAPQTVEAPAAEKINATMIIDGVRYEATVKPGGTAYDAMNSLKAENKIDFSGKNYSGLGFFVEEINGLKNNPLEKNWIYYVNGQPAPVGVSNYVIKNNDLIEWKYEKKSF